MKLSVVFEYFDKATAPMKQTEKSFKGLQKTISLTQNCLWKFNQTAELMGRVGDTMGQLMQPGIEFQQSMADLSSITGIAGKDLERLGKVARETGKSSGLGAAGAANAFGLLASQIDVSKIGMDGLIELQQKTITLAQASGMTMQEAAGSMAGTINQFGLQADQAGRIINVLAAGSKYGAAEIPELAQSFKVVGAAANAAGLSVEQTAGAIEVLSKNNLKGAEAGTALRNIMLKMQTSMGIDFRKTSLEEALVKLKPHMKDATYMSKLFGMENMAAAQFLIANSDMVKEMTDRVTDTNVATEQAAIRTDTWGQRLKVNAARLNDVAITMQQNFGGLMYGIQVVGQGSSMLLTLAPIGKLMGIAGKSAWAAGLGVAQFGRTLRLLSIARSTRSAEVYARTLLKCGRMGRLAAGVLSVYNAVISKSFWLSLKSAFTTKLATAALWIKNKAVVAGSAVMTVWNTLTSAATWGQLRHMAATKLQAIWTFISSKAMLVAGVATTIWSKATVVATWIQGGLAKALSIGRAIMTGGLIPALMGVIATTWAWTAALLANPITWIVLAIAALVAAIVVCWEKFAGFRAVVLTIWDTIKGFGEAVWNWMVAPWKAAWEMVSGVGKAIATLFGGGSWSDAGKEISEGFSKGVDVGMSGMKKAVNGFVDTAAGIGGNYEMHLTEEQAKQEAKEKEKEKEKAGKEKVGIPDVNVAVSPEAVMSQAASSPSVQKSSGFVIPAVPEITVNQPGSETPKKAMSEINRTGFISPEISVSPELATNQPDLAMPEISMPENAGEADNFIYPSMPDISGASDQNNYTTEVERQVAVANNYTGQVNSPAGNPEGGKVEVNFQPVVNISAEMTQKAKDDLWQMLRSCSEDIARMVREEWRKEGRSDYAVS